MTHKQGEIVKDTFGHPLVDADGKAIFWRRGCKYKVLSLRTDGWYNVEAVDGLGYFKLDLNDSRYQVVKNGNGDIQLEVDWREVGKKRLATMADPSAAWKEDAMILLKRWARNGDG